MSKKWDAIDPKRLEIKTLSVENTLTPLVMQVTTLVNTSPSNHPKGKSKKAAILVSAVEKATEALLKRGTEIAEQHSEHKEEIESVLNDTRQAGNEMSQTAREFADDPCSSQKRAAMVTAARALLCALTRLLILADMVDASALLNALRNVEYDLSMIQKASSDEELRKYFQVLGPNAVLLNAHAARRQAELKDARLKDDLAAARAVLKKNTTMLMTASRVYVRFPELNAARSNRDYIHKQICEAVNKISDVTQGKHKQKEEENLLGFYNGPGELAAALDEFDMSIVMDPLAFVESLSRPELEERLENIISGSAILADSSCTRNDRRDRIVAQCNNVRQALQDLLSCYLCYNTNGSGPNKQNDQQLTGSLDIMRRRTKDLRRQLRRAVIDHVSDTYLETNVPLLVLIDAAKAGREEEVEEYGKVFSMHAAKLVEVAQLACSMSSNEEGVKLVRFAAVQISKLCPQVINAARVLGLRNTSSIALENMEAFKQAWELQVRLLTEAVDDITTIDDFLSVSENHILEDVNTCVQAVHEANADVLDRTAGAIRGRAARICNVVNAEMDNYEPGFYSEKVLEAVNQLSSVMDNFAQQVVSAVDALMNNDKEVDENEFIEACKLVYDGVMNIRKAVLLKSGSSETESDVEYENEKDNSNTFETRSKSSVYTDLDEYPEIQGISNAREAYRLVSEEEKQKIAAQVETFRTEKNKFDLEVEKWDETGNEIIVLAKSMCKIMMEMTDFTRGKGPLKTTLAVINAAKKISEYGERLDKLATKIVEQCQESETRKDLVAYLKRIALYCHQLNITSKVKADVQNISGNLIVSGLDSATSLIQAAKNLMNAVVLTVKYSYVASTKYPRLNSNQLNSPIVVWKMKVPEKKFSVVKK